MRVLVVDDEAHLRRTMRLTLEASGYDVAEASGGEEGLRLFGDGRQFDATLLDQRMPGMDGLATLRRMKQERADARIIMVTAYASIDLAIDAMKLGATDFVRKPMTPDTLRHAVAAALGKPEMIAAAAGVQAQAPMAPEDPQPLPPLEIWTTNGFFISRAALEPAVNEQQADHHFVVRRAQEQARTEVTVVIDPELAARVARDSERKFSQAGRFWRQQAERALVNYLWLEAELPEGGRLVVSRTTKSMLDDAMSWSED